MAKEVRFDAEGTQEVTNALLDLVNSYPGLNEGERFQFSTLNEDYGYGFYPSTGAVIDEETKDILGHVHQVCVYPFALVTRAKGLTEARRITIKETAYTLDTYPALTGGRVLRELKLTVPAHSDGVQEDGTEDWFCQVEARYTNDFKRRIHQ